MEGSALLMCLATTTCWGVGMFLAKMPVVRLGWYYQSLWVAVANAIGLVVGALLVRFRLLPFTAHAIQRSPIDPIGIAQCVLVGAVFVCAGFFFNMAVMREKVSLVVAVTSVYPVISATLACIFLRESLSPRQLVGMALVVAGLALVGVRK